MSFLTATANRITLPPMLQKTAGGTRTPVNHKADSRFTVFAIFLCLLITGSNKNPNLWALEGAEPAQVGEGRHLCGTSQDVDGGTNSDQCPSYLIRTELMGLKNPSTKVLIMTDKPIQAFLPEEYFTFNKNVDKSNLYDPTYLLLNRALSSLALLQNNGQDVNEGFTVSHGTVVESLAGIQANINQAIDLLELANGVTRL